MFVACHDGVGTMVKDLNLILGYDEMRHHDQHVGRGAVVEAVVRIVFSHDLDHPPA